MGTGLKVLMIGSDRKLFEDGSAVSERIKEYGTLIEELHIVVFALKSLGLKEKHLASNVCIYPTNSVSRWFYAYNATRIGKKIIHKNKFIKGRSIITTQDPFECGRVGLKIKKWCHLPLEVQLHTDPFSSHFSGFLNYLRKMIAQKVLYNADSVRVVAKGLKSQIQNMTSANISVLPIYVDKKKIEDSRVAFDLHTRYKWRFIILAASRLTPEKNLPLALEVLARTRVKCHDVGLVIAGSGPEEHRLKVLVKKLELENAVAFAGWQNDMTSFYKTADVFIQTSFFEGHQLALVEAGLSGLPIITTLAGIAAELEHGKDAYVYSVEKPDLFVDGIIDLMENNDRRESLRANMRRTLEARLISKDDYMARIKDNWEKTATI